MVEELHLYSLVVSPMCQCFGLRGCMFEKRISIAVAPLTTLCTCRCEFILVAKLLKQLRLHNQHEGYRGGEQPTNVSDLIISFRTLSRFYAQIDTDVVYQPKTLSLCPEICARRVASL